MIQILLTILAVLLALSYAAIRISRLFKRPANKTSSSACDACASDCSSCALAMQTEFKLSQKH